MKIFRKIGSIEDCLFTRVPALPSLVLKAL